MKAGDTSLAALSLEAVTGFRAFVEGEAAHVSGLTAPDEATVRIGLATPLSVLPQVLSSPLLSVVDAETIAGDDLAALDLSGAWAVSSASDDDLLLERRPGFPGTLGAVELRQYDDEEAAYDGFEDGDVDWAAVPSSRYEEAVETYGDGAFAPFQAELFFGMNLSSPSLDSDALRRAIVLAIDRDGIVDAVYADLADPLPTIVPAGVVGNDPDRCPECAYDPDAAADIIDLVYPDGKVPTISIDFDESDAQQAMAELVADDLEAVGIPTTLRPLPLDEYTDFVVSGEQAALQLRVDRRLRVARRLPGAAVRLRRQRQPHQLPLRQGRRPPAPGARRTRRPRRTCSRWAGRGGRHPAGLGRRPDRPVPHPGRRRGTRRGPHHRRRRHHRLGPGRAHRLTLHRLAAPAGSRVR